MAKDKLFSEVKNYLDITWGDKATDQKLLGIIMRGKQKIMSLTGAYRVDFEKETEVRGLLFDYCRLAWAGVPEKFEEIYKQTIVRLYLGRITEECDEDE